MRALPVRLSRLAFAGAVLLGVVSADAGSIEPPPSLHMPALTWREIRAAIDRGHTSVIVPTGGTEQNGPHMVLAKHNLIVERAAERIAAAVGATLVAPVVTLVPEGEFSPPTDNMRFPGTIGISEAAFEAVLDGVARSLKLAGFRTIFLIGDHGQSQAPQARVAERLTKEWRSEGVRVVQVDAYYDDAAQTRMLEGRGETRDSIGFHAGLVDTAELLDIAPDAIRRDIFPRLTKPVSELGGSGAPQKATPELGRALLEIRIAAAAAKIRSVLGR